MTPADWIDRHAAFDPDKPALVDAAGTLDYRAFAALIARTAGALHGPLGVCRGDRVAYLGHNRVEQLALLFACARIGAVLLPLNWRLAAPEHEWILADCRPSVLFVAPEFGDHVAALQLTPAPRLVALGAAAHGGESWSGLVDGADPLGAGLPGVGADSALLLCYTSGTTGRPKGALLDQRALHFNALNSVHMHDLRRDDRVLTTLPLFHVGGLNIQTVPALYRGATVHLHATFNPAATLAALQAESISLTVLVPAQLVALLSLPEWEDADLGSLRAITSGSTLVPVALIERIHAHGIPLIQVYGSTETAPLATYLTVGDAVRKAGSGGLPALHCEVRLVDEDGVDVAPGTAGEVLVRGPSVMSGYWNNPEASAAALVGGWFRSGDIGHVDDDGYLYIDDRKKEVIISGGENIYPAELENTLADHPDLVEAAVVGRPDGRWGEVPVAVVVPRPGRTVDAAAVTGFFDGRLARYKHPRAVLLSEALPRNAMGKVEKDAVRAMVAEAFDTLG